MRGSSGDESSQTVDANPCGERRGKRFEVLIRLERRLAAGKNRSFDRLRCCQERCRSLFSGGACVTNHRLCIYRQDPVLYDTNLFGGETTVTPDFYNHLSVFDVGLAEISSQKAADSVIVWHLFSCVEGSSIPLPF